MRLMLFVPLSLLLHAEDNPREIVRKTIELDQTNWVRMKDYTWTSHETTRHRDSQGKITSTDSKAWETIILFGRPYHKTTERHGKALSEDEQKKEQSKIDRATAKLERESAEERRSHLADYEKEREKNRVFLREIPDAFDFRLDGEDKIDGRDAWVIHASPKPGFQPKHGDAQAFKKVAGKIWIDKTEFQWVKVEAQTIDTISWGLCLARLNPGAKLLFEQTRVNDEVWLPKREVVSGSGRIAVLKKVSEEQETTWSGYRKFHVDSKIVSSQ
ncbi:MAG TPA: hypothetical protein VKR43_03665 [Bryobacteraceae bacterium]|nr:hypothetical protein [Bryobacteraceae bacterium]